MMLITESFNLPEGGIVPASISEIDLSKLDLMLEKSSSTTPPKLLLYIWQFLQLLVNINLTSKLKEGFVSHNPVLSFEQLIKTNNTIMANNLFKFISCIGLFKLSFKSLNKFKFIFLHKQIE